MARPLRIEFPGAVYHVTARGGHGEPIFTGDEDRLGFLGIVAQALARFGGEMLAYCLMGNHYHFVLHTRQANLSLLMRHVNSVYTQSFNRRHGKAGPVMQGRFKAILVDRDAYLLKVCRYVELNPVRAKMARRPEAWPWSSYRAHAGKAKAPAWLDTDGLHGYVLGRPVRNAADRRRGAQRYAEQMASAKDERIWETGLRRQIYLGDEDFVDRMNALARPHNSTDRDIPKAQRRKGLSLAQWLNACDSREEALYRAHTEGGITMSAIARELGLSVSRISRLIAKAEQERGKA
ncbi:MAG: transposase [Betaproteobacteria bacterium]|nr:transposase [Betaproteobacteria bacterium]